MIPYLYCVDQVFCVVLLCVFTFLVPCRDICYDPLKKRDSVRLCLQWFVGRLLSFLFLFAIVVPSTYCVVFFFNLFVFILCLVYQMLLASQDCPFLIVYSVFSNVYE